MHSIPVQGKQQEIVERCRRILIIDDEPINLMGMKIVLKAAFKTLGYEPSKIDKIIDQANNGHEALKLVKNLHRNFHQQYVLVITDLQMPMLDGY